MFLELRDIDVDCIIGDRPEERNQPQRLKVSVSLKIPEAAAETDALEDTIDYVEIARLVRTTLVAAKCRLIERAARLVAEAVLSEPRIEAVAVKVEKSGTVPGVAAAVIRYEMERHA